MKFFPINKDTLMAIFFSLIIFFISFYMIPLFRTDSDLLKYKVIYELFFHNFSADIYTWDTYNISIWGEIVTNKKQFYQQKLTSKELVHYYVISFFSQFIGYKIYLSFINFIFAYSLFFYLRSIKVSYSMIGIFLFSNYYLFMLYFSAERLKIAFILIVWALLFQKVRSLFIFFIGLGFLSHFQTLALLPIFLIRILNDFLTDLFIYLRIKISYILGFLFVLILIYIFAYEHIMHKVLLLSEYTYYSYKGQSISGAYQTFFLSNGFFKLLAFYIITFFYAEDKIELSLIFLIFLPLVLFFSGSRLIILVFFVSANIILKNNNGFNIGFLLLSLYYSIKTFVFIYIIVNCGASGWDLDSCKAYIIDPKSVVDYFEKF